MSVKKFSRYFTSVVVPAGIAVGVAQYCLQQYDSEDNDEIVSRVKELLETSDK
eukprot:Awhi_evm1s12084